MNERTNLRHTNVRLDDRTRAMLAATAARTGLNQSDLIRLAIRAMYNGDVEERRVADAVARAKGAPR
ncbi:MAG: ribbon-helix-helix protein, CopG family [Chloroflexi bacterium]|nr:ribbon-helix-helix protein, CopG family [Chloroflexota bacterium]